jgi:hypothetical protein
MGYTPSFTPQYENGWEDLPIEETPITAEALNAYDDAIENIEEYLASDESQANLADAYDETATYEAGEYVIYGGNLYKCLEDIDTPEEWDSTHWTPVNVTDEMGHGGGGSNVTITPTLSTGTKIADFEIDGQTGELYAPTGGGNANIWTGTQAELEEVFDELEEGTQINITDDEQEVVEGGTIYSEEEQIIGLWTDNRPLYQRTFIKDNINITGTEKVDIATLSDIEFLQVIDATCTEGDGNCYILPEMSMRITYSHSTEKLQIQGATGSSWVNAIAKITVQYTKTTDSPLDAVVGKKTMYIASSDCHSTEEKEVGCWTDGKPLYQKSFIFTSGWSLGSWSTIADLSSLNIENFISAQGRLSRGNLNLQLPFEGSIYPESSNNYKVSFRYYAGNLETLVMVYNDIDSLAVTIRYTKTTDTAGSGQYTPASGKAVHYSTNEQVIGTFLGETLYRKTFDIGNLLNNGTKTVAHGISNLKYVINWSGTCYSTIDTGYCRPIPLSDPTATNTIRLDVGGGNISIKTASDWSAYKAFVTLEYTKTV